MVHCCTLHNKYVLLTGIFNPDYSLYITIVQYILHSVLHRPIIPILLFYFLPLFGMAILFGRHLLMLQVATISTWVLVSALTRRVVVWITVAAAASRLHGVRRRVGMGVAAGRRR